MSWVVASAVVAGPPPADVSPVSPRKALSHEVARLYFLLSPDHDVGIGVRAGPSLTAERTGGGVFPGDVVVGRRSARTVIGVRESRGR